MAHKKHLTNSGSKRIAGFKELGKKPSNKRRGKRSGKK